MFSLEEIHTDGGYGSEEIDQTMEQENVLHVTTAARGRERKLMKWLSFQAL